MTRKEWGWRNIRLCEKNNCEKKSTKQNHVRHGAHTEVVLDEEVGGEAGGGDGELEEHGGPEAGGSGGGGARGGGSRVVFMWCAPVETLRACILINPHPAAAMAWSIRPTSGKRLGATTGRSGWCGERVSERQETPV